MEKNQTLTHLTILRQIKLRKIYAALYPDDKSGIKTIGQNVTLKDVWDAVLNKTDVYEAIGGIEVDSIVRERTFELIADILNTDYNDIYYLWLAT